MSNEKQKEYQKKYDKKTKMISVKYGISDMNDYHRLMEYLKKQAKQQTDLLKN